MTAQAKHIFQRIKGFQQLFAGNIFAAISVKRVVQRSPERLDILFFPRLGRHGHAAG